MKIELCIFSGKKMYIPVLLDGVTWTTERKGSPGKLEFKVRRDDGKLRSAEGNAVTLLVNGKKIFFGYIFKKQRSEKNTYSVFCFY